MHKFVAKTLLATLISAQAMAVYAQDDTHPLPAPTTSGNASWISGGIGIDESTAMKEAAPKYPLELVFGAREGATQAYNADVHVKVTDRAGKTVIDTTANGPYLLAALPNGSYKVEATADGVTKTERADVKKGAHKRLVFSW